VASLVEVHASGTLERQLVGFQGCQPDSSDRGCELGQVGVNRTFSRLIRGTKQLAARAAYT
jgi:hypothetical protein